MKPRSTFLPVLKALLVAALTALLVPARAALPVAVDGERLPSLAPMLEKTSPAVVNISTTTEIPVRRSPFFNDPFFEEFFSRRGYPRSRKQRGLGSGVIIDAREGLVVTNAHVIRGADEIGVTLQDGRNFDAEVVGSDEPADIAVIRIPPDELTAIEIGDSDGLRVGDFVVAIGNPFGLQQTVTSGIVSGLGRSGLGIEDYEDFIQTDASINPGNSGGALVNLRGELVGINTAIQTTSGGSVGIGFAIPAAMAIELTDQLVTYGKVQRGRLGVEVQDLTPALAEAFGVDTKGGAVVSQVVPGSAADLAGLQAGDVVVRVNRKAVDDSSDFRNAVGLLRIDSEVRITAIRGGQTVQLQTRISPLRRDARIGLEVNPRLRGAVFGELDDQQLSERPSGGVLVSEVERGSPAWSYGLRAGDIVVSVNRQTVRGLEDMRRALTGQRSALLNLQRGSRALFLLLQ